ncbi:MAG TPA: hypothetical protein VI217_06990 [Mycobacterium sp.]|jgi:hypothetical protein
MADDEFRVLVELGSDDDPLSLWEKLRSLDLDDDAQERLGSRVTITRDGDRMILYTATLSDAEEAERTVQALVAEDDLSAEYSIARWNGDEQEWEDPADGDPVPDDAPDVAVPDPSYVILDAYKPEFLRDLGL